MDNEVLARLISQVASGDGNALRDLVQLVAPRLKGWLLKRYGGVLQPSERDTVLADAVTSVWRFAGQFQRGKGCAGAWLIAVTRNAARSYLRGEERFRDSGQSISRLEEPEWLDQKDYDDGADGTNDDRLQDLEVAIRSLPKLQRAVIEADLAAGGHADDSRLASMNKTTVGSIQVSRNKARKGLLRLMLGIGYDPTGTKVRK